jgi:hypothetical protein
MFNLFVYLLDFIVQSCYPFIYLTYHLLICVLLIILRNAEHMSSLTDEFRNLSILQLSLIEFILEYQHLWRQQAIVTLFLIWVIWSTLAWIFSPIVFLNASESLTIWVFLIFKSSITSDSCLTYLFVDLL